MNIAIKSTNLELTSAIKDYTEKRLSSVAKYVDGTVTAQVELAKTTNHHHKGEIFMAEINLTTALGKQYRAVSEKTDLYEAIDDVRSDMVRELAQGKSKQQSLYRRGAQKIKNMLRGFRS